MRKKDGRRCILPGVNFCEISPKGDGFLGLGVAWDVDPGDTHMGMHLRRLLGRPWLCTGSNSRDRLRVAQAISRRSRS